MINKYVDNLKIKGSCIETKYGIMRPVLISEYEEFMPYISFLKKLPRTIKSTLFQMMVEKTDNFDMRKKYREELKNHDVVYFMIRNDFGLKDSIKSMLDLVMEEYDDSIYNIILSSENHWNQFRKFILDFNGIVVQDESDDPEVRKFDGYSQALKEAKGQAINFESMYTSIIVKTGMTPEQINILTIYQFYSIFRRISAFFNYNTSTLYKTVDAKNNITVVPWSTIIEDKKQKEIKLSEFADKFGEGFN